MHIENAKKFQSPNWFFAKIFSKYIRREFQKLAAFLVDFRLNSQERAMVHTY